MTELQERVEQAAQKQAAGALAEQDDAPTIFSALRKMEGQFAAALPSHVSPAQFLRVAITELRLKPELQECSAPSLFGALMLSAQLGLVPGPLGHVYLVPRGNRQTRQKEVTFQIGYKGYVELASRSGIAISGGIVREGDVFDFQDGTDPSIVHRPNLRSPGEPFAYWVAATKPGMLPIVHALNKDQVESYRKRSPAAKSGPWVTDYDAMALKTVVRRIVRWLPLDTERAGAVAQDDTRPLWQPGTHELTVTHTDDDELLADPEDEPPAPADEDGEPSS
jgi:recombination protein RecT